MKHFLTIVALLCTTVSFAGCGETLCPTTPEIQHGGFNNAMRVIWANDDYVVNGSLTVDQQNWRIKLMCVPAKDENEAINIAKNLLQTLPMNLPRHPIWTQFAGCACHYSLGGYELQVIQE